MNYPKDLTGQRSFCTACAELFRSTAAFDRHRVGKHGHDRRCRTIAEMEQAGMVRNARGDWTTGAKPQGVINAARATSTVAVSAA